MDLKNFLAKLRKMGDRIRTSSQKALYKNESFVLRELRKHSPKDSGYFASQWRAKRLRFGGSKTLAGLVITNKTPIYGQFVEGGAKPGKAPWYFPHRNKKGQMRKHKYNTGKLKLADGRVWAGGLDPGHDKTVGGAISKVISDSALLDKLTVELSDESIKAML